jgi:hypothetical protein
MIRLIALSSLLALAACGEAPAQEGPKKPTANDLKAAIEQGGRIAPPTRDTFAEKFAAACPSQKPVNKADCRAQGMGSHDFTCKYGLGDDEYLRHEGVLSEQDGEYVLLESEKVCAQGA